MSTDVGVRLVYKPQYSLVVYWLWRPIVILFTYWLYTWGYPFVPLFFNEPIVKGCQRQSLLTSVEFYYKSNYSVDWMVRNRIELWHSNGSCSNRGAVTTSLIPEQVSKTKSCDTSHCDMRISICQARCNMRACTEQASLRTLRMRRLGAGGSPKAWRKYLERWMQKHE